MRIKLSTLGLALLVALAFAIAFPQIATNSQLFSSVSARTTSSEVKIGLYTDSACTQTLTAVIWGNMSAGSTVTKTFYVKNLGLTSAYLAMSINNWNPITVRDSITVTWNRENALLKPNGAMAATISIKVASNASAIANFNFDIAITAVPSR